MLESIITITVLRQTETTLRLNKKTWHKYLLPLVRNKRIFMPRENKTEFMTDLSEYEMKAEGPQQLTSLSCLINQVI
jgi:uncharacterized protein YifE (UPF0438 family)